MLRTRFSNRNSPRNWHGPGGGGQEGDRRGSTIAALASLALSSKADRRTVSTVKMSCTGEHLSHQLVTCANFFNFFFDFDTFLQHHIFFSLWLALVAAAACLTITTFSPQLRWSARGCEGWKHDGALARPWSSEMFWTELITDPNNGPPMKTKHARIIKRPRSKRETARARACALRGKGRVHCKKYCTIVP